MHNVAIYLANFFAFDFLNRAPITITTTTKKDGTTTTGIITFRAEESAVMSTVEFCSIDPPE